MSTKKDLLPSDLAKALKKATSPPPPKGKGAEEKRG